MPKRMRCEIYDEPDAMREAIPEEDFTFWESECKPYPNPKDKRPALPDACTYKIKDGKRTGHCCQCGECCKPVPARMKDGDVCRYAYQEE